MLSKEIGTSFITQNKYSSNIWNLRDYHNALFYKATANPFAVCVNFYNN